MVFRNAMRQLPTLRKFSTSPNVRALYFTKKHEWVKVDGDQGTVGISSYAQEALGDIVFAQLPDPDSQLARGEECGALESVKAASEVYSPVTGLKTVFFRQIEVVRKKISGTVVEKNEAVESGPSLINTSSMDEGWLFKVKLAKPEEIDELMNQEAYDKYLKEHEEE